MEEALASLEGHIDSLGFRVLELGAVDCNENDIMELYDTIENDMANIEYLLLPSLKPNRTTERFEFNLQQQKNRFHHLQKLYRKGIVDVKSKEQEEIFISTVDIMANDTMENERTSKEENETLKFNMNDENLKKLTAQEKLLKTNTQLTNKLQNVSTLMKSTILASEINMAELEASNSSLVHLGDKYNVFGDMLKRTNSLVVQINKASKHDRVMIYRAIYFFITVSIWIIWRRLLRKPIKLFIWIVFSSIKIIIWGGSKSKTAFSSSSALGDSTKLSIATVVTTLETSNEISETIIESLVTLTSAVEELVTSIVKDEL